MPPHLAGREDATREFERLLVQDTILENLILTGLRGVGKTVLLDTFKPLAIQRGWLWVGTDLSESVSVSEQALATRLITDLSVVTSSWVMGTKRAPGFAREAKGQTLSYPRLMALYEA
ncbi:MAG: ATP-binding protein, partial [Candidatus Limnocylindria bacterium]